MMSPMKKKKFDKEAYFKKVVAKERRTTIVFWIILFLVIWFIVGPISLSVQKKGFNFIKGTIGSSEAEDYCADSWKVKSAKTDFAAKKAFDSCVKNY